MMRPAFVVSIVSVVASFALACGGSRQAAPASPSYVASGGESVTASYATAADDAVVSHEPTAAVMRAAPESSSGSSSSGVAGPPPAPAESTVAIPEKLVIEGYLRAEVDDVRAVVAALHGEVVRVGGRVVSEAVQGAEESWSASLKLRVPPGQVDGVVAFLGGRGEITEKRITATDVSRTLFEQELELGNKRAALERLRKVLEQGGLTMADVLAIEKELTRLRGEIEQLEGARRFLVDRVQLATLDVLVVRKDGAILSARTKFYPGPRVAVMTLFDAGGRPRTRLGGGVALHVPEPRLSFELDVFERAADEDAALHRAVVATFGAGAYSDFLGRGKRRFGNPYLGARLGYGYLDGSTFVLQGEVGVELFKSTHVLVDLNTRMTGFMAEGRVDTALITGGGLVIAF